jgi:hypothetical protein
MTFVTEDIIDSTAADLGGSEDFQQESIERFRQEQPVIFEYFFSEDFEAFTKGEKEYALFLALVVFESIKKVRPELSSIDEKAFLEAEESNWEKLQAVTARRFKERMDVFFEAYPQEDLLAFVEDSLIDDQDTLVTKEGREPLFVFLKTIIDCLNK